MWHANNTYVITGDPSTRELDLFHLVLAPTFACNLRCKHCYLPDHAERLMPWERVESLVRDWRDIVLEERGPWGGVFHLKGGEPTTMEYFESILGAVAETTALRLIITTNGLRISNKAVEILRERIQQKSDAVILTVSVDGGTAEEHDALRGKGTWQRTWRTIDVALAEEVPIHLNFVLTRSNRRTFRDLLNRAISAGVTQVNILPFVRRGYGASLPTEWLSATERYTFVREVYDELPVGQQSILSGTLPNLLDRSDSSLTECVVGYAGLYYILPDGAVYSCPNLAHTDFLAGHLDQDSLPEVHERMKTGDLYGRVPSYGTAALDVSCKGAVVGEVRSGSHEEALLSKRLAVLVQEPERRERAFSACFSRNI